MNGELASLVSLCLHGSAWLASTGDVPPPTEALAPAFRYVGSLRIQWTEKTLLRTRVRRSDGVAEWLGALRAGGCTRLLLLTARGITGDLPAHIAASFSNGGSWAIVTDGRRPRVWLSRWSVAHPQAADSRIWAVDMLGRPFDAASPVSVEPASAAARLRETLAEISWFAATHELEHWRTVFDTSSSALDDPTPTIAYGLDLAPETLSLPRRQLLAAATLAWVFGGMGSWNDLGFRDDAQMEEYNALTSRLYDAVLGAVVAAVNAPD
ncbi:hypothetical protein [Microbacterium marinilacus]|uniref:Uncharacterized protein n=1 Tax=Microbacterium marinilacus TaxID=415209 RepID=A0ABP7BVU6_9MICO|nr:hypothetical protein [Microbacterium marinilacus]MBY0688044.1 hypothetical protein [Microbacterium marinilacus]